MSTASSRPPRDAPGASILLWAAAPVACQIFLFGPALLWALNPGEVQAPLASLLAPWLVATLVAVAVLAVVGRLVPAPARAGWVAVLLGLGVAAWIQGQVLVADYGLLDGQDLDFARHAGRGPWELAVWLGVLAMALAVRRRLASQARFVALVLLVLGASGAGLAVARAPAAAEANLPWRPIPEELFALSRQRNVVHLLFDGFQSDVFAEIVEGEPALQEALDGFVFFADHAGAFPTTTVSVPAMLTGRIYDNRRPISRFLDNVLDRHGFLGPLRRAGYRNRVATITPRFARGPVDTVFAIPKPWVREALHRRFLAAQLVDVSLFRHAPHVVKPAVHRDQRWLLQGLLGVGERSYHAGNGRALLEAWTARVTATEDAPLYTQIHVGLPHLPVVLDGDCRWIGVVSADRASYRGQARCAVRLLVGLLERLRELGIYDRTVVLVTSDHGADLMPREAAGAEGDMVGDFPSLAGSASALLAVKPLDAHGALRTSPAPTAITDVPATLLDLVGLPTDAVAGAPALELAAAPLAERERQFGFYRWQHESWQDPYLRAVHRLRIAGPVAVPGSWRHVATDVSPELRLTSRRLDFGSPAVLDHLGLGWGRPQQGADGETFTWALGGVATVLLGLPPEATRWRARFATPAENFPQRVTVSLADRPVATWTARAPDVFEEHELEIPAAADRAAVSELVLRFARYRRPSGVADQRPLAVRWSRLDEVTAEAVGDPVGDPVAP